MIKSLLQKISFKKLGFKSGTGKYFSVAAQVKRRLNRFYQNYWFWLLGVGTIGVVLGVSIMFQSLLSNESRQVAVGEIEQLASATAKSLETRLTSTVSVLRGLAQDGNVDCGGRQMLAFAEAAKGQTAIVRISLVGPSGYVLCSTAPERNERFQLLPQHVDLHPRVTLVQPDRRAPHMIVASWHTTNGIRLAGILDGRRIEMDAPPAIFSGLLHRQITLQDGNPWIEDGLPLQVSDKEGALTATAEGRRFPIQVSVAVPSSILRPINLAPKLVVPLVALLLLVVVGSTVWRLNSSISQAADSSIENALDDGQIQPLFQPLIDLTSGRILGAEVLMRWQQKDGTIARPGDFIHRVEQANLTRELTVSLLNSAINELGETYREMPSMTLSINLFPNDIKDDRIVKMVEEAMDNRTLRSEQIIFEVTERRGLENIESVQGVLAGLSKLGARIALDNAGAGHLGLSGLRQLWPDVVKIDKVLVDALGREDNARSIIDTIVSLADELAIGIVAEGVENIDQMVRLNSIGVTAAQGYLFSKPLPGEEFKEFLKNSLRGDLSRKLDALREASDAA